MLSLSESIKIDKFCDEKNIFHNKSPDEKTLHRYLAYHLTNSELKCQFRTFNWFKNIEEMTFEHDGTIMTYHIGGKHRDDPFAKKPEYECVRESSVILFKKINEILANTPDSIRNKFRLHLLHEGIGKIVDSSSIWSKSVYWELISCKFKY
jgi:hypothetical protein